MKRTTIKMLPVFAASLCGACVTADPREPTDVTVQQPAHEALYQMKPDIGIPWPADMVKGGYQVPVCFSPPGTTGSNGRGPFTVGYSDPTKRAHLERLARRALEDSWSRWTELQFTGFETCTGRPATIVFNMEQGKNCGGQSGLGYHADSPVDIWLAADCTDRQFRTLVMHEVGHALALEHEMNRNDAFMSGAPLCVTDDESPGAVPGGTLLTDFYDDVSVMNYCAPPARDGLSHGDILGAQKLYGVSDAGHWLSSKPAVSLFTL